MIIENSTYFMSVCVTLLCLLVCIDVAIGSGYYIHEWPAEFSDVYPPYDAQLAKNTKYDHAFYENSGAGRALVPEMGLFQTYQFSLFKNLLARLSVSRHRTYDAEQASAFIVPFDGGVHSILGEKDGRTRLGAPLGWSAIGQLQEISKNGTYWKNYGHDHFVIFSITINHMLGVGVKVFLLETCMNCTVITIETSPTFTSISGRTRKYWYAAPYPSSFHWHEHIKHLPWLEGSERDIFSLFIGSLKTDNPMSNALRRLLRDQCAKDPHCEWHHTKHTCKATVNDEGTKQMMLFRRSVFCPAPPGDSLTRKSLFDSLVAGCIPVIFVKASLTQYLWFFNWETIQQIAVYIAKDDLINGGKDYIEVLKAIPPEQVQKMQQTIAQIAPTLQYAVVPSRYIASNKKINKSGFHGLDGNNSSSIAGESIGSAIVSWDPPVRDAGSVIIDRILDGSTIEPVNGFTDEEFIRLKCKHQYNMETYGDTSGLYANWLKNTKIPGVFRLINGILWNKELCTQLENTTGSSMPLYEKFNVLWHE